MMLIAVGVQLMWGSGYLVDYYVNTDYYKSLCVNKEMPELNCDGKCILAQKIKTQSDKKTENPETILPISSEYLWNVQAIAFKKQTGIEEPQETRYHNHYVHLFLWDIFKPPV